MSKQVELGNLYDFNKSIIKQLKPLSEQEMNEGKEKIINFVNKTNSKYYMLLCRERYDYTTFNMISENAAATLASEMLECLLNRAEVKSINLTSDESAIECWLDFGEDDIHCYYLFNYEFGVLEV